MTAISADELKVLTQYIYSVSGVSLDASKAYLLETRLKGLLQKYACATYLDLHAKAKNDRSGNLEKEIVDAITTNETLFFRDNSPFEVFKHKILPDIIDARSKTNSGRSVPVRIWSAACSTGQEVYSIAIALRETLGNLSGYNISILGTDISDDAVSKASYGKYNRFEIERGLPSQVLNKYFTPTGDGWKIRDEIRSMAVFKKFNLMKPFAGIGKFDVVFCRNVAIYFTPADKKAVFEKIGSVLENDGSLIIGSTESLSGVTAMFEAKRYLRSIFYQLSGAPMTADRPAPPLTPPSVARPGASLPARPTQPVVRPTATAPARPAPATRPSIATPAAPPSRSVAPQPEPAPAEPVVFEPEMPEAFSAPEEQARNTRSLAPRPAPRPAPVTRGGDKSELKRLLMLKRQGPKT